MSIELSEAAKEARRAYYREYYQKHKEADKAKSARFWERKGEELRTERDALNEIIEGDK